MNQKLLQKQFVNRAQMLARVMTSTPNIKVTISGTGAYRQPGLINIPSGDFTDPEWVAMVHGWIDHELGHEDESDYLVSLKAHKESPLLNNFRNIIEDVRMEKSRGQKFRGARLNLARLVELAVKRGVFQDPSECEKPILAVQMLCLYYGRYAIINQDALQDYALKAKRLVANMMGQNLMDNIVEVIHKIDHAKDNADSLKLAREVMSLIQEELDKQKQQQQQQQQQQDNDDSDDNSDDDSAADNDDSDDNSDDDSAADNEDSDDHSDDDSAADNEDSDDHSDDDSAADNEDSDDSSDDDSKADNDDSDDSSDDDSNSNSNGSNDDEDDSANDDQSNGSQQDNTSAGSQSQSVENDHVDPSAHDIAKALEQLLNADEDDCLEDFHEQIADMLSENAEEAQREHEELNEMPNYDLKETKGLYLGGRLDEATAKKMSSGVFQTMHKVLFDQVQNLETARKTGSRIINKKISGIPAGNLSVFKRHVEQQDVTAALSLIVDASGSMHETVTGTTSTMMEYANTCAFAFAAGLERSGVPVEVTYYGLGNDAELVYVAKKYDEKAVLNKFKVVPDDTTPTGEMMMRALTTLALRPEKKKMLVVITDGEANYDSVPVVETANELAASFGIKVVPIGICTGAVSGFDKHEFVSLSDPSQLTSVLREAVKLKLF